MQRVMIIAGNGGQVALLHLLAGSAFPVVATIGPVPAIAHEMRRVRPDLVLIDIEDTDRVPPLLEFVNHGDSSARIVVLGGRVDRATLVQMIAQGVRGFLLRESVTSDVLETLREVMAGGVVIDPAVAALLIADITRGVRLEGPFGLSRLEQQVLAELAAELTNKQIGQRIGISTSTVKTHLTNMFRKLGVRDRVEAALFATEHGLS